MKNLIVSSLKCLLRLLDVPLPVQTANLGSYGGTGGRLLVTKVNLEIIWEIVMQMSSRVPQANTYYVLGDSIIAVEHGGWRFRFYTPKTAAQSVWDVGHSGPAGQELKTRLTIDSDDPSEIAGKIAKHVRRFLGRRGVEIPEPGTMLDRAIGAEPARA